MDADDALCAALLDGLRSGRVSAEERARIVEMLGDTPVADVAEPTPDGSRPGMPGDDRLDVDPMVIAIDRLPGGVIRGHIDPDGELWFDGASAGALQLLNLADDALPALGETVADHASIDHYPIVHEAISAGCIDGSDVQADSRIRGDAQGATRWARFLVVFDAPADETGARFTLVLRDDTQFKKTAEALSRADAGFRAMLRSANSAFGLIDLDDRLIAFNDLARIYTEAIGWTLPELDENVLTMLPPSLHELYRIGVQSAATGTRFERRMCFSSEAGEEWVVDVAVTPVRRSSGEIFGVASSFTDVTGQVDAERALEESDRIVTRLPLAIVTVSKSGAIQGFRARAESIFGLTAEAAMGTVITALLSIHDRQRISSRLAAAIMVGESLRIEVEGRRADGTLIPLELTLCAVSDEAPDADRIVLLEDITRRRAMHRQVVESHKLEAVGLFAAGLAHDLNNLLAAIVGHATMLDLDMAPDDPRRDEIRGIEATTERAATLVRALLGLARQRKGAERSVDVSRLTAGVIPVLERLTGNRCTVILDRRVASYPVRIDPVQLEQIIINLVVNARDAFDGAGTIRIALDEAVLDAAEARRLAMMPGPTCRIQVRDDGPGIAPEALARVFDPFFSTKRRGQGTGLGLSICRQILRSRGGEIRIDSTPGEGCTVTVWLPRSGEVDVEPGDQRVVDGIQMGDERILLVEDVDALRKVWRRLLSRLGYAVSTASDGAEALDLLELGHRFDLLISDVVMPRLGGVPLARRFRETHSDAPIVLVSAYTGERLGGADLADLGACLLHKPIDGRALARRIRELLDAR